MRLSIAVLDPSSTLNSLKYIDSASFSSGDTGEIWMQLIDLDSPLAPNVYSRYMPASGATLNVSFFSNNDANAFVKPATQPIPADPSIWKVVLNANDTTIMAGPNLGLKLTQGGSIINAIARNVLSKQPASPFQC